MPETGYLRLRAYESYAQIPLQGVAITVTATDGTAIAMGLTDRSGQWGPVAIPVPQLSAGLTPNTGVIPFTNVNLYARLKGYEQIEIENLQVFADTTTNQNLEMVPLSELPGRWDQIAIFDTPPQNL